MGGYRTTTTTGNSTGLTQPTITTNNTHGLDHRPIITSGPTTTTTTTTTRFWPTYRILFWISVILCIVMNSHLLLVEQQQQQDTQEERRLPRARFTIMNSITTRTGSNQQAMRTTTTTTATTHSSTNSNDDQTIVNQTTTTTTTDPCSMEYWKSQLLNNDDDDDWFLYDLEEKDIRFVHILFSIQGSKARRAHDGHLHDMTNAIKSSTLLNKTRTTTTTQQQGQEEEEEGQYGPRPRDLELYYSQMCLRKTLPTIPYETIELGDYDSYQQGLVAQHEWLATLHEQSLQQQQQQQQASNNNNNKSRKSDSITRPGQEGDGGGTGGATTNTATATFVLDTDVYANPTSPISPFVLAHALKNVDLALVYGPGRSYYKNKTKNWTSTSRRQPRTRTTWKNPTSTRSLMESHNDIHHPTYISLQADGVQAGVIGQRHNKRTKLFHQCVAHVLETTYNHKNKKYKNIRQQYALNAVLESPLSQFLRIRWLPPEFHCWTPPSQNNDLSNYQLVSKQFKIVESPTPCLFVHSHKLALTGALDSYCLGKKKRKEKKKKRNNE